MFNILSSLTRLSVRNHTITKEKTYGLIQLSVGLNQVVGVLGLTPMSLLTG